MNIAFWSNVRHQSGVTSGVALMSVLWAELFVEEVAVTSNHICNYGLIRRLQGGTEYEERTAKKAYNYILGEPEYFRMLYGEKSRIPLFLNDSLSYVPMEGDGVELFGTNGLSGINNRKRREEFLFIDTACGYGQCSQKILEEAELTVVMFPDSRESIDDFFQSESPLAENSFFILGNVPREAVCRPSYLTKRYGIPEERIGLIPYNSGFEQAMKDGTTIAYITGNMYCSKRNSAYHWIYSAKKTVKRLREYAIKRRGLCGEYERASEKEYDGE